jgi:hypothetical protein
MYRYLDGETVTFFLGDTRQDTRHAWKLGNTTASEVITPLELMGTDFINQQVRNVLRLLQSLDSDTNPSNGIELPVDNLHLVDGDLMPNFSLSDDEFAADPVIRNFLVNATAAAAMVSAQQAVDHFQNTLNELLGVPTGSWSFTHGTVEGVAISGLTASIHFDNNTHYTAQYSLTGDSGAVSANYSINGMSFDSAVDDIHLNLDEGLNSQFLADLNLIDTLSFPGSTRELINVVLAIDANLRVLPNSIVLESPDGKVVLEYARSDAAGNDTIAYLEINPPGAVLSKAGEALQLDVVAHASTSAVISPVRLSWQSSDATVATVNSSGKVTAVGNGVVIIKASAAGFEVAVQVEVSIPVSEPTVNVDTVQVAADQSSVAIEPDKCPKTQPGVQTNVEHVSQENVSVGNLMSIEQTNQQSVVQNSNAMCVPAKVVEAVIP